MTVRRVSAILSVWRPAGSRRRMRLRSLIGLRSLGGARPRRRVLKALLVVLGRVDGFFYGSCSVPILDYLLGVQVSRPVMSGGTFLFVRIEVGLSICRKIS